LKERHDSNPSKETKQAAFFMGQVGLIDLLEEFDGIAEVLNFPVCDNLSGAR